MIFALRATNNQSQMPCMCGRVVVKSEFKRLDKLNPCSLRRMRIGQDGFGQDALSSPLSYWCLSSAVYLLAGAKQGIKKGMVM